MARLNEDEEKLFAELEARRNAPDEDEDFEIEVYDTAAGKGARVPYKKGKSWLYDVFGIGDAPEPPAGTAGEEGSPGGDVPSAKAASAAKKSGSKSYFGQRA